MLKETGEVAPAKQGSRQQVKGRQRSAEEHEACATIKKKKKKEQKQPNTADRGKALQTSSHLSAEPHVLLQLAQSACFVLVEGILMLFSIVQA